MAIVSDEDGVAIVRRLTERTRGGRLAWEKWEGGGDQYWTTTANFIYYVKSRDQDGVAPFNLEVWRRRVGDDDSPAMVDELSSADSPLYRQELIDLYELARAKALRVDTLKNDILSDLE